jgi:hypothetical protein
MHTLTITELQMKFAMLEDDLVLDFFHGRKILKVDGMDERDPQNREKNAPAGMFTCMEYLLLRGLRVSLSVVNFVLY